MTFPLERPAAVRTLCVRLHLEPEPLFHLRMALVAAGMATFGPDEAGGEDARVIGVEPDGRGLAALESSVAARPDLPHIAWSPSSAAQLVGATFATGAQAFVWGQPQEIGAELAEALRALLVDRRPRASSPFDEFLPRARALSPREREVLAYIAGGMDNLQIAAHLGVCERTVKSHVTALYRKLAQENRAQLALLGARLELSLPPHDRSRSPGPRRPQQTFP